MTRRHSNTVCVVEGCGGVRRQRDWCSKHYQRWRAHGDPEGVAYPLAAERFWARVDQSAGAEECWPWTAGRVKEYGRVAWGGVNWPAHRLAWALSVGPVSADLVVCHHCDSPPCCNPAHLFLGTQAENLADMVAKGRQSRAPKATGDQHGSRTHPERIRRGQDHGRAKLADVDVPLIRIALAAGEHRPAIAARFGVSRSTIFRIAHGLGWTHLP